MKDREEIYPFWSDDDKTDARIENVIKAFFCEFSDEGDFWEWDLSQWEEKGVKVSPKKRLTVRENEALSDEESRKRCHPSSTVEDEDRSGNFIESMKLYFKSLFDVMTQEMNAGFDKCDRNFQFLGSKVEAVEQNIAQMKRPRSKEARSSRKSEKSMDDDGDEQVKSNNDPILNDALPTTQPERVSALHSKDNANETLPEPTKESGRTDEPASTMDTPSNAEPEAPKKVTRKKKKARH